MRRFAAFLLAAAIVAAPAHAQVRPQPGAGDPRIQTVMYDADQVVLLQVPTGYELTVEFAPDERIENVAVGDSAAWQVTPNKRGDRLFLKPIQGSTTNMTVVTDARTYVFELSPGSPGSAPYIVRFQFPPPPTPANTGPAPVEPGRYKLAGSADIRPDAISDDGSKTYIIWRDSQTLPAVFVIDRDGKETLADGAMRDGRYVLDSINNKLVFRLDKKMATAARVPQVAR
ncbi:MAG: TrbG/VirB9 family P-type conjugative transfer protein [Sphingomonas sp.]|uniref:TrbG/VirB9 family P-type conjugative transfer protein n=1 Tax=Sphingomonas sp. TaxID=28214 RepID=UPI003F822D46